MRIGGPVTAGWWGIVIILYNDNTNAGTALRLNDMLAAEIFWINMGIFDNPGGRPLYRIQPKLFSPKSCPWQWLND